METIFNAALEAVSLASPTGLSLSDLWNRLADPAAALGAATLPPTMRRAIWQMLTERKDDIIATAGAVPLGAEPQLIPWDSPETENYIAAEAANIHLVASAAMQDACLGVYAARLNRFQLSLPQRQTLRILGEAKSRGALQSVLTTALGIENRNYSYVIKNLEERGLVTKCPTVLQKGGGHVTSTNLIVLTKFAPEEMTDPQARFHDGKSSTIMQDMGNDHDFGSRRIYNNRGVGDDTDGDGDNGGGGGGDGSSGDDDDDDNIGFDDLGGVQGAVGGIYGSRALSSVQCLDTYGTIDPTNGGGGGAAMNSSKARMNGAGGDLHMVLDDDVHLRKVTTFLASLPDHSSNETDLKKELGYVGKRGHRRWRRLRNILGKMRCIERYKARESHNQGSVVFIVKLLKAYTGEIDEEWLLAALLNPLTGKLNVFGEQVAELTLDRQILTMLAAAGPDGITTQQVDGQLKFNIKRNEPRFKELKMRYGEGSVVEQHINQGKVRLLRYNASPEFLAILDSALLGVSADGGGIGALEPPPGGYLNAVREAINAGLNDDGTNPLAKYASPAAGEGAEEEVDLVAHLLAAVGNDKITPAPLTSAAAAAAVPVSEAALEEDEDEQEDEETEDEDDNGDDAEKKVRELEAYAPTKRKKQPLTEMAQLRRRWIVDRVNREGLLLCSEIGSYLQSTERAVRNNLKAVRPDRKVIQRLIDVALEANELVLLRVTFPGVHGSLTARTHDVLAKPDTQADSDFVDLVFAAHRHMLARIRQSSSAVIGSKHEDAALETLPIVANAKRTKEREEREAKKKEKTTKGTRRHGSAKGAVKGDGDIDGGVGAAATTTAAAAYGAIDNNKPNVPGPLDHGLIGARMQRVWRIHELAWKLLDARNGAPSPFIHPSLSAAAAEGKVFLVGHAPVSLLGGRPLDMGVYTGTSEQQAIVVTTDEFWKALTVEDFIMCLGSRSTDVGLVQEFKVANKRMGELRRRDLVALAGGIDALTTAKSNLTRLLDILTRMGLICAIVPFGEGGKNLASAGSASYLFRRRIQYEEPIQIHTTVAEVGGDGAGTSAAAAASPAAAPPATAAVPSFTVETKLHTFDATTLAGRNAYWLSMEYMVMCSPMAGGLRGRIGQNSLLTECFPFSKATEAINDRSWVLQKSVLAEKLDDLVERISTMVLPQPGYMSSSAQAANQATGGAFGTEGAAGAPGGIEAVSAGEATAAAADAKVPGPNEFLTWEGAVALAKESNVPFETVARAVTKVQYNRMRGVIVSSRRLGALGGRGGGSGSTAALRKKYREGYANRRKRRRGGASDDDTDIENQEGFEIDNLDLSGGGGLEGDANYNRPVKQRKKKWFAEEDRELLHAWATWLAAHGPDKILRWKFVKGRPRGVMPISCKYRIQVLKANEKIGPMMMKILELAGGVHSRRVLRGAAREDQERNHIATGGDAATAVGEKRKADGDHVANEFKPASKRACGEDGAIAEGEATAADLPPLWTISNTEDASALKLVVAEIENVVSTAPSRYKKGMKKPDQTKTGGADGEYDQNGGTTAGGGGGVGGDRRWRSVLGGLGGRLLGPAARGPVIIARQFTALCQWARAAAAARANGTARPPMPSVAMAMELVKSLLLAVKEKKEDWAFQGVGSRSGISTIVDGSFSTALTDRFRASDIKEAIAELIRLGHVTVTGGNIPAASAAGGGGGGGGTVPIGLALSNRFMVEMQPLFLHGGLFNEAYAAHAELVSGPATLAAPAAGPAAARDAKPTVKTLLPLTPSSSSEASGRGGMGVHEVSGGAVAAVLSTCFTGTGACAHGGNNNEKYDLAASLPRSVRMISTAGAAAAAAAAASQQQPASAAAALAGSNEADDENEENMLRVLTSIKVTATVRGGTTYGTTNAVKDPSTPTAIAIAGRPSSAAAAAEICIGSPRGQVVRFTDLNGVEHKLQFSSHEEVLYQPSLVASDAKLRTAAEAACKKLFRFKKIGGTAGGGGGSKSMDQMLKSLRAAGDTGLTPSDFLVSPSSDSEPIPKNSSETSIGAETTAKCLKTSKEVEEALGALCRCGLARRVTGYDDIRIVASDIAPTQSRLLAFPPPENITSLKAALASLNLPPQGTVQPCVDVPIRPWVDHVGRLKPSLWRALLHRAVSTVLQYPGVGGDVLLQSLRVANPQHAREVMSVLCAAGIFYAKKSKAQKKNSAPRSVLAACFGDAEAEEDQNVGEEDGDNADGENLMMATMYGGMPFPTSTACTSTSSSHQNDDSSWNFFIDPGNWWQAMEVLPPAVLVPVHAER